jgi:hypothetical protein
MSNYLFFIPPILLIAKNFSNIVSFVKNFKTNTPIYKEIYRTASWKTMIEFLVFKARISAAHHLETGLLSGTAKIHNLVYYDGPSRYSIRSPKKRGPCTFSQVTTIRNSVAGGEKEDVTEKIREFAGPSHNFHGIPTTPDMLDFSNLTFVYRNGMIITYESGDCISVLPKLPEITLPPMAPQKNDQ